METVNGYELNAPYESADWSPREFNLLSAFAGLMPVSGSRVVSAGEHYHNMLTDQYGTSSLFVTSGGYVGIGTTSPSEMLTVNGAIRATGAIYKDKNAVNEQSEDIYQKVRNADSWDSHAEIYVQAYNNAADKWSYASLVVHGGDCSLGYFDLDNRRSTGILLYNSQNSNPIYLGAYTANDLVFGTNNLERMRITSDGTITAKGIVYAEDTKRVACGGGETSTGLGILGGSGRSVSGVTLEINGVSYTVLTT